MKGGGPSTYYQLAKNGQLLSVDSSNISDLDSNRRDLDVNTSDLDANTGDLAPQELQRLITELTPKARKDKLWPVILWLCTLKPHKADELAKALNRKTNSLKNSHLNVLRVREQLLEYLYPEVQNHPEQAYKTTDKGRTWLQQQGITV